MKTKFGEPVIQWTGDNVFAISRLLGREITKLPNGSIWFMRGDGEMATAKRGQLIKMPKYGDKLIVLDVTDVVIEPE